MSYALEFAPNAKASLNELDAWLQEEVLDEIEQRAAFGRIRVGRRGP